MSGRRRIPGGIAGTRLQEGTGCARLEASQTKSAHSASRSRFAGGGRGPHKNRPRLGFWRRQRPRSALERVCLASRVASPRHAATPRRSQAAGAQRCSRTVAAAASSATRAANAEGFYQRQQTRVAKLCAPHSLHRYSVVFFAGVAADCSTHAARRRLGVACLAIPIVRGVGAKECAGVSPRNHGQNKLLCCRKKTGAAHDRCRSRCFPQKHG